MIKFKLSLQHPVSGFTWVSKPLEMEEYEMRQYEKQLLSNDTAHVMETEVDGVVYFAPYINKQLVKTIIRIDGNEQ